MVYLSALPNIKLQNPPTNERFTNFGKSNIKFTKRSAEQRRLDCQTGSRFFVRSLNKNMCNIGPTGDLISRFRRKKLQFVFRLWIGWQRQNF